MADPARVKPEGNAERVVSSNEEQANHASDETEDKPVPAKTEENKESSSQEKGKQEPKLVSCTACNLICTQKTYITVLLNHVNQKL